MAQEIIFDKAKNKEERLHFVKFWAKYVKSHDDKEWSKQQAMLINSQLRNAKRPREKS